MNQTLLEKITIIFKSPIDAGKICKEYSEDLLQHAIREYEKWKLRENAKYESIPYFRKILQTGFYKHSSKGSETNQKNEEKNVHIKANLKRNEILHEIIGSNREVKDFLVKAILALSEKEREIIKARGRNHICYARAAEKLDMEYKAEFRDCKDQNQLVEIFNKKFENLEKLCMLVEMRIQLLNGFFWEGSQIKSIKQLEFLKQI